MKQIDSSELQPYQKEWISYEQQIDLLIQRGLIISDRSMALQFLKHVTYYRFSGYCLAFESERHNFFPDTTFAAIRFSYEFNQSLGRLIAEALTRIEIDLRNVISHSFGKHYGPFGHTIKTVFYKRFKHELWINSCRETANKSTELFTNHFRANYSEFPDLPIWMVTEIISFGDLSRMYKGMLKEDQKSIAGRYRKQPNILVSWLHHLVYIRNICAHHARLWDRQWAIKPSLPVAPSWKLPFMPGNDRLFSTLLIILTMLNAIPEAGTFKKCWKRKVEELFQHLPSAPNAGLRMGLTTDWKHHPGWNMR